MLHVPVLLDEIVEHYSQVESHSEYFLDGTFGRGGHTKSLLDQHPQLKVVAFDQDHEAIEFGKETYAKEIADGRLFLIHDNFKNIDHHIETLKGFLGETLFSGVLLDLGVSSPQLDVGERGFSFYHDGPLDMRMDQRTELTAADIVNTWSKEELTEVFQELGEVRRPFRVVEKIIERRKERDFKSTLDLSTLIEAVEGWRKKGHHPATNYFMALRLEVNNELGVVEEALSPILNWVDEGGRFFVITFHSLEDRITKNIFKKFKEEKLGFWVNKKVIQAQWPEKKKNPRSRSAKLRIFQKGGKL